MLNIDTADKKEQRKFGLAMAAIIAALGLLRWALHGFDVFPSSFFVVAAAFFVPGLLFPKALQPIFYLWMKLALALNFIMMHLLLALAFYLMITPVRIIRNFTSSDALKRAWLPEGETYWEDAEKQPEAFERYRKQY